jgi:hypothetical protein
MHKDSLQRLFAQILLACSDFFPHATNTRDGGEGRENVLVEHHCVLRACQMPCFVHGAEAFISCHPDVPFISNYPIMDCALLSMMVPSMAFRMKLSLYDMVTCQSKAMTRC